MNRTKIHGPNTIWYELSELYSIRLYAYTLHIIDEDDC